MPDRVTRISPDPGNPTATLGLGEQRPVAPIVAAGQLCVLTADGKLLSVRA